MFLFQKSGDEDEDAYKGDNEESGFEDNGSATADDDTDELPPDIIKPDDVTQNDESAENDVSAEVENADNEKEEGEEKEEEETNDVEEAKPEEESKKYQVFKVQWLAPRLSTGEVLGSNPGKGDNCKCNHLVTLHRLPFM